MGQKVHPIGFRLGITQKHLSRWYALRKNYSKFFFEDRFLRQIFQKYYGQAGFKKIEIARQVENHLEITLQTEQPHRLIGSKSQEMLKQEIKQLIEKYRQSLFYQTYFQTSFNESITRSQRTQLVEKSPLQLTLRVQPCSQLDPTDRMSASLIGDFLIEQLEKRVAYRFARNILFKYKIQKMIYKGIKIQISGRLNGAEIARCEWIREARLPLQTLDANIDYSCQQAYTIYGVLGIKVWVFQ